MKYFFSPEEKIMKAFSWFMGIGYVLLWLFGDRFGFGQAVGIMLLLFVFGLYMIFMGIQQSKSKRIVEDIPTSRIQTAAVGSNVEIDGNVVLDAESLLIAPISGLPCAGYRIAFEEWNHHRDTWHYLDSFSILDEFYLEDDSGALALVDFQGAKFKGPLEKKKCIEMDSAGLKNLASDHPALQKAIDAFREQDSFSTKPSIMNLTDLRYRFVESGLYEGKHLYVLGYARSGLKVRRPQKVSLKSYLKAKKMLEEDEELAVKYDTNKDGKLDYHEMEKGAQDLGRKLEGKNTVKRVKADQQEKIQLAFKHSSNHPLLISTNSQAGVAMDFAVHSFSFVRVGILICVISAFVIALYWDQAFL